MLEEGGMTFFTSAFLTFALSAACFFPCSVPSRIRSILYVPWCVARRRRRRATTGIVILSTSTALLWQPFARSLAIGSSPRATASLVPRPSLPLIYLCLRRLCHQCIVKSAQSAFSSPLTPPIYTRARLSIFFHMCLLPPLTFPQWSLQS